MEDRINILYSDASVAVAVKPAGLLSESGDIRSSFAARLEDELGGAVFPVHRLDRETRGVMVYARTPEAASALSAAFSSEVGYDRGSDRTCPRTDKLYLAVVLGKPESPGGEYRDLLYHDARRNKSYAVSCARRGVREARLLYRVCGSCGAGTLVAVRLLTGRTHQIRVQFASRGTPVCGDRRYGGKSDEYRWGCAGCGSRGMALACVSLSFPHPVTGERMRFVSLPTGAPWDRFDTRAAVDAMTV